MSKHVNTSGNYSIKVADSGTITLDTGLNIGQVHITGDLVVDGQQTTVSSTNLNINDNIIVLNANESGSGVTLTEAGIRIERGSLADVQFLFNENITWNDPVSETTKQGAFVLKDENGSNIGLEVRSISTGGGDLFLINAGTGVISVSGTNNYETQVTDDDDIPNRKYVIDEIVTRTANLEIDKIISKPSGGGSVVSETKFVVSDKEVNVGDPESSGKIYIDNNNHVTFWTNRTDVHDLEIKDSTIRANVSGSDLTLSAPGTGSVVIDDQLKILSTPSHDDPAVDPAAPTDGLVLYVKAPEVGKTGLFYVNSSNVRDEILSKNRSLLLSMIF